MIDPDYDPADDDDVIDGFAELTVTVEGPGDTLLAMMSDPEELANMFGVLCRRLLRLEAELDELRRSMGATFN